MPAKSLRDLVDFARRHSPFYAELYRDVPDGASRPHPAADHRPGRLLGRERVAGQPAADRPADRRRRVHLRRHHRRAEVLPVDPHEHADSVTAFGAGMVPAGPEARAPGGEPVLAPGELYGGFLYIERALHNAPVENVRLPVGCHATDEYVADLIANFGVNVLAGPPMKLAGVAEAVIDGGQPADTVELLLFAGDLLFDDLRPDADQGLPEGRDRLARLLHRSTPGWSATRCPATTSACTRPFAEPHDRRAARRRRPTSRSPSPACAAGSW